tara:strand:+ start:16625 stop:17149 length:525 start_codon:yes stop_codon:yes gene_type:complete
MKLETLKKLTPSSPELSGKRSKVHNAISTEDVLLKLSYSKLTNKETDFIIGKYLNDDESLKQFYKIFIKELENKYSFKRGEKNLVCDIVKACLIECTLIKCPFCSGRGFYKLKNNIRKCDHCADGDFIYTNVVRANLTKIPINKFQKFKNKYERILSMIQDVESDALEKIGDFI